MEDEIENKYNFILFLLEKGDAMVCLDARHSEVKVPENHKSNPAMSLILNLNFRRNIDVQQEGIIADLTFQGRPFKCDIPFKAVWAIFSPSFQEGQVWEESLPKDVDVTKDILKNSNPKTKRKPFPRLDSSRKTNLSGKTSRITSGPKKDRSHLRVIK